MKNTTLKSLACVTAMLFMPILAVAGGTNTQSEPTTGQKNDPSMETKQGDMGNQGVGNDSSQTSTDSMGATDDSSLSTSVQDALKKDAMLRNLDIKAEVSGGVVTLSGEAKDLRYKARASKVARSVKGVKSVKNDLTLGKK